MMFKTPFLFMTTLIMTVMMFFLPAQKAHKEQELERTADDLKSFNKRFRFKRDRSAMPTRFQPFSATADTLRRTSTPSGLAIVAGIAFVIFKGPSL